MFGDAWTSGGLKKEMDDGVVDVSRVVVRIGVKGGIGGDSILEPETLAASETHWNHGKLGILKMREDLRARTKCSAFG